MPWRDWQFWAVTLIALAAILYLFREVLPQRISPWKKRGRGVRTSLTIGGKSPGSPTKK